MTRPLRLSVWIGPIRTWEDTVHRTEIIEASGWAGIWVADHPRLTRSKSQPKPRRCMASSGTFSSRLKGRSRSIRWWPF
ncbi:MAG: hypothetical protein OXN44_03750 [Acidimicrobiaceae bacterium]|nr:hypothetical protein [Acidimicrobiaceae bacterium]